MRNITKPGIAVAIALVGVLGIGGAALADGTYPTQGQVNAAKQNATAARTSLSAARADYARVLAAAGRADQAAEIASERYNGAMWKLSLARKAAHTAELAASAAQKQVRSQRTGIADLVVRSYQDGSALNGLSAFLGSNGPKQALQQAGVVRSAGDSLQADYQRFVAVSNAAQTAQDKATRAAAAQVQIAATARSARAAAAGAASRAEALASQARAKRDALVRKVATTEHTSIALANQRQAALEAIARKKAEEAAKRRAEAAAAAAAKAAAQAKTQSSSHASSNDSGNSGSAPSNLPAPSNSAVAAAISYAKAQLGKPYLWAAAGPDRFDCSGLTMMAWRQGGVYLPHFSGAQYDAGTPIPIADARPGDLYFWSYNGAPSGIHHVAIALGNGEFIEAPHTGAFVRYNNISNEYPNFAVRL